MIRRAAWLIAAAGAVLPGAVNAQNSNASNGPLYAALGKPEGWTILGSVRVRLEGIDGQFRPALNDSDALLAIQTTLFAQYQTDGFRFGGELIDARGYLEKKVTSLSTTEVDAVELSQAYVGYDFGSIAGGQSAVVTAGRQIFNDGSRRLIARNQYRNTINSFTGVRFDWTSKDKDLFRLFWLLPHTRLPSDLDALRDNDVEYDRESLNLQFFAGSFTKQKVLGGSFEFYIYALREFDSPSFPTRNRRLVTPGIRFARAPTPNAWDWDIEADYQFGRIRNSVAAVDRRDLPVSAYFVHAEAGHTFDLAWHPRLAVKFDRASGDKRNPGTFNRFDTLFGARRFDFGPTSFYGAFQRANISSPAVQVDVAPSKRLDGFVAYRPAWLANRTDSFATTGVRDANGRTGKFAGHQIEGRVRWWAIPKLVQFDVGAATLIKGTFLRDAPNAPDTGDTRYGYASVQFNF